jgi:hypothetical protein
MELTNLKDIHNKSIANFIEPKTLTGKQFNKEYKDVKFIKLTNKNEIHNEYQYKTGLNEAKLIIKKRDGHVDSGGIEFCEKSSFKRLLYSRTTDYMNDGYVLYHYRSVMIPDDAKIYCESNKGQNYFKTDRIYLGDKKMLWNEVDMCMEIIQNKHILSIPNTISTKCLDAIKQKGFVLLYPNPYEEYYVIKHDEICKEINDRYYVMKSMS